MTKALDPLAMLLDAARFIEMEKPEWAKAARRAVAAARLAAQSDAPGGQPQSPAGRDEIAMIIDPEAFVDAMLQDDLTPSERMYFDANRQTEKLNALQKADEIIAALSLSRPDRKCK
jgi:hypothetical protein